MMSDAGRIVKPWYYPARLVALGLVLLGLGTPPVLGQSFYTVVSDGFGDGDLDNNGTALEAADTRQGSYIPNKFGTFDGPIDPDTGNPTETGPRIPSLQQEIDGGTLTLDSSDTGIKWFSSAGFTSSGTGDPRAQVTIVHDTTAAPPEDMDNPFSRFPGTDPDVTVDASDTAVPTLTAINDGLALGIEAKGGGNSATGFFGQTISLGDAAGDQLRVGFDFRPWISAPNDNGDANPPNLGELRFGIYEDTDSQLGMTNPTAGVNSTPAIWGEAHGDFRANSPGAHGDAGFLTRVQVGDTANPPIGFFTDGSSARIQEEANLDSASDRFLEGGTDHYAGGASNPFGALSNTSAYRLELTLTREIDEDGLDAISAEYTVTDRETGATFSMSGQDRLRDRDGDGVADDTRNYFADEFDYFAIRNTGASTSNDWDYIIDNFRVEIAGSNVPSGLRCDAQGGFSCDLDDLDALYAANGTANANFDYSGDGLVGDEDIDGWLADASQSTNTANPDGVTYKQGDANLNGAVDSADLGFLLNNFGSASGVTWRQGDFNLSGGVDSSDLGLLLNSFGFSSSTAAAAVVPEPSAGAVLLLGMVVLCRQARRRRTA